MRKGFASPYSLMETVEIMDVKYMNKVSFNQLVWIWLIGWIPISLIIGYIVITFKWNETINPLIDIVISSIIFLVYAILTVIYLEKKKK
jgi:hypothetical protein